MSTTPTIIALTGHKGAGKDTVADVLCASLSGAKKFAFADALRNEVCAAFGVPLEDLTNRDTKEQPSRHLRLYQCANGEFVNWCHDHVLRQGGTANALRSPRSIMQWWGEWRRSQDELYWVLKLANKSFGEFATTSLLHIIVTDCRHVNEARWVLNSRGALIHIARPATDPIAAADTHESEAGLAFPFATHTIHNTGDLAHLRAECERVLAEIRGKG